MDDDKFSTNDSTSTTSTTNTTTDSDFDTNKLDNKDAESSTFHVTTRYKWILALSILFIIAEGILIYAYVEGVLAAEVWQVAVWGACVLLSLYAIVKKSLAAVIFNMILFLGISLIPAWGTAYLFFKPIIDLFTGAQ